MAKNAVKKKSQSVDTVEYGDADALRELATDVKVEVSIVDNGIGHYEYWGAPGFDSRPEAELQNDPSFQVCFSGPLPPEDDREDAMPSVHTSVTRGGCDGEHSGKCRESCKEYELDLYWRPSILESDEEGTLVEYTAETA